MNSDNNIVLITIDSLRADSCGFTGGQDSHTPAMDRLADDGLVFESAIAPGPATTDSMPVIFSGEFYPMPEADWSVIDEPERIRDHMRARETIPERLRKRGYETAAFTTNPWTSRRYGFDEGFDYFEDFMSVDTSTSGLIDGFVDQLAVDDNGGAIIKPLQLLQDWRRQNDMFQSWETFYDDVIEWTERAEEPYFLWIFLVDAHMPYLPAREFRSQSQLATLAANMWLYLGNKRLESIFDPRLRQAYGDTVRYIDDRLSQMTDDLADDDPLFVVHGDHGEEFGERGVYGHGQNLSEELIRVPLLIANGPGGRIDRPFSLANLPVLLERLADGCPVDDLVQSAVQSRNFDPKITARGKNWKYVEGEDDEKLYGICDERPNIEIRNQELQAVGQDIVANWQRNDDERQSIKCSVREVIDSAEF